MDTPSTDPPSNPKRRRRVLTWALGALAVVVIAVGGFLWWFFRDDAPDAVSIADAAAQVDSVDTPAAAEATAATAATAAAAAATTSATAASDVSGAWSVDTSIGEFSYEDSTGTFVGFRVEEELTGIGSTTAVGRTPEVTGTLVIDGTTVTEVTIEADMTAITTNESRRDDKVQSALETERVPDRHVRAHRADRARRRAAAGETVERRGHR